MNKILNTFYILIILSSLQCHSYKNGIVTEDNYYAIKYKSLIELVESSSLELLKFEDSIYIYYYKERIVLKIPAPTLELTVLKNKPELTLTDSGATITPHFRYFFYKNEDSLGKMYSLDTIHFEYLKVDSVFTSYIKYPLKLINKNNADLISSEKNNTIETYVAKIKPNNTFADTIKIYFSNAFSQIPFTFSKELSKENGDKVCKVEYIYKANYDSSTNQLIPKHKFRFSIDTINAKNDAFINKLLKEN